MMFGDIYYVSLPMINQYFFLKNEALKKQISLNKQFLVWYGKMGLLHIYSCILVIYKVTLNIRAETILSDHSSYWKSVYTLFILSRINN